MQLNNDGSGIHPKVENWVLEETCWIGLRQTEQSFSLSFCHVLNKPILSNPKIGFRTPDSSLIVVTSEAAAEMTPLPKWVLHTHLKRSWCVAMRCAIHYYSRYVWSLKKMNFGKGPHAYANCKYAYQKCPIWEVKWDKWRGWMHADACQNGKYIGSSFMGTYFEFSFYFLYFPDR